MDIFVRLLIAGVMIGTLYGLVAVTLTLMLRSTGVLSFAHAGFALISAYVYNADVCPKDASGFRSCADANLSPGPAAAVAVLVAVAAALLVERLVARPLAEATPATKVIATAAVLGLISGVLIQVFGAQPRATPPEASRQILPRGTFEVAGVVINKPHFSIFVISIVLVAGLALVLRRSWFGLGVRAAGQLPSVARLMGVSPTRVSRFNWALGGLLAGIAGVLIGPVTIVNAGTFSFLLVKAVGAILIGGLVSLPLSFLGGIAIGVVEALAPHFWHTPGVEQVAVTTLILAMLRIHGKRLAQLGYVGPTQQRPPGGKLSTAMARGLVALRGVASRLPRPVWVLLGLGLLLLPLRNAYYASIGAASLYYCLVALSILVLTGTSGQVTFMQAGFAAVGAFGLATAEQAGWNLLAGLAASVAACVLLGVVVGAVALRFRGLEFAIASIAVGAVLSEFVVTRPGVKANLSAPELFGYSLLDTRNLFALMLICTTVTMVLVANVRRSGWGRTLTAMRDMQTLVGHFGVAPVRSEVALVAMSAGIAGLAGCFLALTIISLDPIVFVPLVSVTMVLAAVVGGLRSLWGPILAGLVFGVGQEIVGRVFSAETANAFPQTASAGLALLLIVGMPNGLASMFSWARDIASRAGSGEKAVRFRGRSLPELAVVPRWAVRVKTEHVGHLAGGASNGRGSGAVGSTAADKWLPERNGRAVGRDALTGEVACTWGDVT